MTNSLGGKTIYSVYLKDNLVLTIRRYDETSDINKDEQDSFIMSISYLGKNKDGVSFLLTKEGYVVGKIYNKVNDEYILREQTDRLDTVEPFFERFQNDLFYSSTLSSLDHYNKKCDCSDFVLLCENLRLSDLEQLSTLRNSLSYKEKLNQQKVTRKDPIEAVLMMLHEWENFVIRKIEERHIALLKDLDSKKLEQNRKKRFGVMDDLQDEESLLISAYDDLKNIKNQLKKELNKAEILKLKKEFDRIQDVFDIEEDILCVIDEKICNMLSCLVVKKDFGFKELGE